MSKNAWMIRAGEGGYLIDEFAKGVVTVGWHEAGQITDKTQRDLRLRLASVFPDSKAGAHQNAASVLWRFAHTIAVGDSVVTYDPAKREYLIGEVASEYRFDSKGKKHPHRREVKWLNRVLRDVLSVATRNSLGSTLTLFAVPAEAIADLEAAAKGKKPAEASGGLEERKDELVQSNRDAEEQSRELIEDRILALDPYEMQELVAAVLRAMGNLEEAEMFHRRALEIRSVHDGASSLTVADSLNNLAAVLSAKGDRAEARAALERSLEIRRGILPAGHARIAQSVGNLGVFIASGGDYESAIPLLREALVLEAESVGSDHPSHAVTLTNLAIVLERAAKYDDIETSLRAALAIRREAFAADDPRTAQTLALLGRELSRQLRYQDAESALREAIGSLEATSPGSPVLASARTDLARLYEETGRPELAKPLRDIAPPQ